MNKKIKFIIISILAVLFMLPEIAADENQFVVVIGSFSKLYFAELQQKEAVNNGFESDILKMNTSVGMMYRVSANKPTGKSYAMDIMKSTKNKLNIKNAWLLKIDGVTYAEVLYDKNKRIKQYTDEIVKKEKSKSKKVEKNVEEKNNINVAKKVQKTTKIIKDTLKNDKRIAVKGEKKVDESDNEKIIKVEKEKLVVEIQNPMKIEEKTNKKPEEIVETKEPIDLDVKEGEDEKIEVESEEIDLADSQKIIDEPLKDRILKEPKKEDIVLAKEKKDESNELIDIDVKEVETEKIEVEDEKIEIESEEIDLADSQKIIDEPVKTDEEMAKIDWDNLKSQYLNLVKAIINKDFDFIQNHIDENGFLAVRNTENKTIADHYISMQTLFDLINYYGKSFKEKDFIFNLKKYNLSFAKHEKIPHFNCDNMKYRENGVFMNEVNPYDRGFLEVIQDSELLTDKAKALNILSSTNIEIVRTEVMDVKAMYFTYYDGKLWLRFIDFSDYCN